MKAAAGVVAAACLSLLFFDVAKVDARDSLEEACCCSFVIPPEFVPSGEAGLFVNKNHPMESSSIMYSVYDNGLDSIVTNREKLQEKNNPVPSVTDESINLTKEIYEETISAAYNSQYGQDVGYSVESFSGITVDGYPGYKIVASYEASGEERVHQTVYMLISKYRTFTITMQRAEDDDCEAYFEECAATLHVH